MRIIFMGTPNLAAVILKELIDSEHDIASVVTQPDKESGRGRKIIFSPVKQLALEHGIKIFQPEKISDENILGELEKEDADIFVVVAYAQKLPLRLLEMARFGCINLHPSMLPKYRGAAPLRGAILNGDKTFGISIMKLVEKWDAGDILLQKEFEIEKKDTTESLEKKVEIHGALMMKEVLCGLEEGSITPVPQDEDEATYIKQVKKEDGKIDFNMPAEYIERQIRACTPWPGTYTYLDGKVLKIWDADFIEDSITTKEKGFICPYGNICHGKDGNEFRDIMPGLITTADKDLMIVRCVKGCIKLNEVQLEGKKRMNVSDFLRGKKIERGTILGG